VQWLQHRKQVRGINKYSKDRHIIDHTPSLKARELVLVHRSSIERKDSTSITVAEPRITSDTCPWIQAYKSLPAHLRRIIGPGPPPPDISSNTTAGIDLRMANDGSVENELGYHGWIIAPMDNITIIEGYGPTDGRIEDTTACIT
jgi:hypothetical protein